MSDVACLLRDLGANKHIDREKALSSLQRLVAADEGNAVLPELEGGIEQLLRSETWECRLGGLLAAKVVVGVTESEDWSDRVMHRCLDLLEDGEVRVRDAVGACLGALAAQRGVAVFDACRDHIVDSIRRNFVRDRDADEKQRSAQAAAQECGDLASMLLHAAYTPQRPGEGDMRHGTEGWKCLETSCKALQQIISNCGDGVRSRVTLELRQLVYDCLRHQNRFVRETGFFVVNTFCAVLGGDELAGIGDEVAMHLGDGLSDNWSQVRYAASVATRTFMMALPQQHRAQLFPAILPHMCLNRYYLAEGVRLYSQETWRLVLHDEGRVWIARCMPQVVAYYIMQSKANNHAVREAACYCIAELLQKIDRPTVEPYVEKMLRVLVNCFKDASWPVRDAACTACGRAVMASPDAAKPLMDEMYELWFAHLWDNIRSVRENSAVALGCAIRAYGDEALERIVAKIREMLPMAKQQEPDSQRFGALENVTRFGVAAARAARSNDPQLHTDQTMFSCGSLAPKLQRGGGCMDHGFAREKEMWEASDGAVYMVRELCVCTPQHAEQFMEGIAELTTVSHFMHAFSLHETVWLCLPTIAQHLGKRTFKRYLELFLPPLFRSLTCGHQLAEAAAGKAIVSLHDLIGPTIFMARLTPEQRQLFETNSNVTLLLRQRLPQHSGGSCAAHGEHVARSTAAYTQA